MSNRSKIFIAGAGGMLGQAFHEVFGNEYEVKCTDKDVNESWLSLLDFRDLNEYDRQVCEFKPDYLFHLGAYTDLEFCEMNVDDTYLTNTISVENAVTIANKLQIPLLYISTAGIFDGKKELYDDWDAPNPLGHYARSKYFGERHVIENCNKFLICRAGWMMGGGPKKDKKFINKLIKQIEGGARELFIVNDKDGTPTYTRDFAENVKALLQNEIWGLYNLVCKGQTSRIEVARELLDLLGMSRMIDIKEVDSNYFKNIYFAERPISERLVNRKLALKGYNLMRDWKSALKDYVTNDFSHLIRHES